MAALTAAEWFSGANKNPNMMSLDPSKKGTIISSPSASSSVSSPSVSSPSVSTTTQSSAPLSISVTVPSSGSVEEAEAEDENYVISLGSLFSKAYS